MALHLGDMKGCTMLLACCIWLEEEKKRKGVNKGSHACENIMMGGVRIVGLFRHVHSGLHCMRDGEKERDLWVSSPRQIIVHRNLSGYLKNFLKAFFIRDIHFLENLTENKFYFK